MKSMRPVYIGVALIGILSLVGCGKDKKEDPAAGQPAPAAPPAPAPAPAPTTTTPATPTTAPGPGQPGFIPPGQPGFSGLPTPPPGQPPFGPGMGPEQLNSVPQGQYWSFDGTVGVCPQGYTAAANNLCTAPVQPNTNQNCGGGYQWQNFGCRPQNFVGCPQGSQWSSQYQGCYGYAQIMPVYYQDYECRCRWDRTRRRYTYVYFYVGGAPRTDVYWNGYGWVSGGGSWWNSSSGGCR